MAILQALNREWSVFAESPTSRRTLMRWSSAYPVFVPADDLDDVLPLGYWPDDGPEICSALARLTPTRRARGAHPVVRSPCVSDLLVEAAC